MIEVRSLICVFTLMSHILESNNEVMNWKQQQNSTDIIKRTESFIDLKKDRNLTLKNREAQMQMNIQKIE